MNSLKSPDVAVNLCADRYCISPLVPFPFISCIKWEQIARTPIKHNNF